MTKEAKFKKIIEKALNNGWDGFDGVTINSIEDIDDIYFDDYNYVIKVSNCYANHMEVIFSHKFAKAIWGEEKVTGLIGDEYYEYPNWQHHLQQAVISDDPIDYYYKNM